MNSAAAFNITAAVVMGALGVGALFLNPGAAHDVCLAVVSGLTGALASGGGSKLAEHLTQTNGPGAVVTSDSTSPQTPKE